MRYFWPFYIQRIRQLRQRLFLSKRRRQTFRNLRKRFYENGFGWSVDLPSRLVTVNYLIIKKFGLSSVELKQLPALIPVPVVGPHVEVVQRSIFYSGFRIFLLRRKKRFYKLRQKLNVSVRRRKERKNLAFALENLLQNSETFRNRSKYKKKRRIDSLMSLILSRYLSLSRWSVRTAERRGYAAILFAATMYIYFISNYHNVTPFWINYLFDLYHYNRSYQAL